MLTITCKNELAELERLADAVQAFGRQYELPADVVHAATLAVDEILTNIVTHGYHDGRVHPIVVRLEVAGDELRMEVEDEAPPFDPLAQPAADTTSPLAERPVGGLGIHLVRQLMDKLEYHRREHGNLVIMCKKIVAP